MKTIARCNLMAACLLGALVWWTPRVEAQAVPTQIAYQGILEDLAGNPVDDVLEMNFAIYDVEVGGTPLSQELLTVTVVNGVFDVLLFVDPIYLDGSPRYLGVTVGTDSEMQPRQYISSVPYSLVAGTTPSADYATTAGDADTVDGVNAPELEESQEIVDGIVTHTAIAGAHHGRYTDSECLAAVSTAGYLTSESDPEVGTLIGEKWCHADLAGSAVDCTDEPPVTIESDPVFGGSDASGITSTDTANWNAAYGWGSHAAAGYLTAANETDPEVGTLAVNQWCTSNGAVVNCTTAPPVTIESDPEVAMANDGDVPRWDSTSGSLVDGSIYDNGTNIGIGTTIPGFKLDVNGTIGGTDITCTDCLNPGDIGDGLGVGEIDETTIQQRVAGTCSLGSSIRLINQDGTVTCEPDDAGGADSDWTISGIDMYSAVSGNVGIGTTAPGAKLYVYDQVITTTMIDENPAIFGKNEQSDGSAGHIKGIMGRAVANSSTNTEYAYGVFGSAYNYVANGTTGYAYGTYGYADGVNGIDNPGNTQYNYGVYGNASGMDQGTGSVINTGAYGTAADGDENWAGYFEGNTYVGGNVGIGTTSPEALLQIRKDLGSATFQVTAEHVATIAIESDEDNGGAADATIQFYGGGGIFKGEIGIDDSDGDKLKLTAGGAAGFSSSNGITIQSTGNVGIGTTTPGSKLEVAGTIESTSGGFVFPDSTTQTTAATTVSSILAFSPFASVPMSSVSYVRLSSVESVEADAEFVMPRAGTAKNLYVVVRSNTMTTTGAAVTVRKNGVDTAVTVDITIGTTGIFSNTSNSASFSAGDELAVKINNQDSTGSVTISTITMEY